MSMPATEHVEHWDTDYDVFHPDYAADPFPIWDQLRQECPVPHTDRWGGSWMPVRFGRRP